ncbi:hypothetical protein PHABIO_191 [Pseudomonas phage Phabio]|uniref:Uncharacterized protein n=2 Tax=root TaxID=1 RepID=A0A1Y0STM4_9CAUD|nr:hypothetical protein MZD05_gp191 [Pseudomonas phage Phabio]ARV76822.1 hypothetical protein PHABIO_191 [Pseudomonas phage Phabio]
MFNSQLPVPFNQLDQSTFNGNLPNGNDKVPQIQLSQQMMQNQQIALQAIGYFRAIAQSTAQKTPLHVFCYNLLSQNGFQNQVWAQWCQHLVVFTELLIMAKGYNTQDAIKMACTRLYEAFLSGAFKEYHQAGLNQVVPQQMWPSLEQGVMLYQQILADNQKYIQGGVAAFQQQQQFSGFGGGGSFNNNSFAVNNSGSGNLPRINAGAVTSTFGQPQRGTGGMPLSNSYEATQTTAADGGLYDEPIVAKPLQPVEEISSDIYSQYPDTNEYIPMNNNGTAPTSNNNFTQVNTAASFEDTELHIPLNVEEVIIDPLYYQPTGFQFNSEDPYGLIFNPGGIEIRPAHQSNWDVTPGDDMPYLIAIDPNQLVMFHVKFPDGTVKEKAIEWNADMDYMRHELNTELRRRAQRPNGIVVETKIPVSSLGKDPQTEDEIKMLQEQAGLKGNVEGPVILSAPFNGSTDMEIRAAVSEAMSSLLGVEFNAENPMPPCEYVSIATHYLNLTEEEFQTIKDLSECGDIPRVATDLYELGQHGFDTSYYRFLNSRLTKSINRFMRENMSLTIEIDDFVSEAVELMDYLAVKKGERYLNILRAGSQEILRKAISVEQTDGGTCVIDYNVNFQLGWYLDELTALGIHSGKPVLVSTTSHPVILETLRGMIKRAGAENINSRNLRLITADGAVLELIRGYLVDKAMLLKLVK